MVTDWEHRRYLQLSDRWQRAVESPDRAAERAQAGQRRCLDRLLTAEPVLVDVAPGRATSCPG